MYLILLAPWTQVHNLLLRSFNLFLPILSHSPSLPVSPSRFLPSINRIFTDPDLLTKDPILYVDVIFPLSELFALRYITSQKAIFTQARVFAIILRYKVATKI